MVEVKQAISIAKQYVADVFASDQVTDIRLEEVRVLEEDNQWRITIGFSVPEEKTGRQFNVTLPASEVMKFIGPTLVRKYKEVRINRDTGEVAAMIIRDPLAFAS